MNSYYYWMLFLFFIILGAILVIFVDVYAGFAVLFFFFILLIFYYTLDYPDTTKTVYMRRVNEDGSETVIKQVEEVDEPDLVIEKETTIEVEEKPKRGRKKKSEVEEKPKRGRKKKSEVEETVTVEQTSDFFGDTETIVETTKSPKKKMRKSKTKSSKKGKK